MLLRYPFHPHHPATVVPDEELNLLRDMISNHFGIHFDHEKTWMLRSKIQSIMAARGHASFMDYYQQLVRLFYLGHAFDHPEWTALVTHLANHETYFFREHNAMEEAVRRASGLRAFRTSPWRILSAGCSTGEETYSLAACFLEAGFSAVEVVGIDLDPTVIALACEGRYPGKSFRAMTPLLEERYGSLFVKDGKYRRVRPLLQKAVQFIPANLMNADGLDKLGPFDFVFCRNVVIYFDPDGMNRAVANLRRLLVDQGLLFLGHSESLIDRGAGFAICHGGDVVYYRKK